VKAPGASRQAMNEWMDDFPDIRGPAHPAYARDPDAG
jgi:hypothetical protein